MSILNEVSWYVIAQFVDFQLPNITLIYLPHWKGSECKKENSPPKQTASVDWIDLSGEVKGLCGRGIPDQLRPGHTHQGRSRTRRRGSLPRTSQCHAQGRWFLRESRWLLVCHRSEVAVAYDGRKRFGWPARGRHNSSRRLASFPVSDSSNALRARMKGYKRI